MPITNPQVGQFVIVQARDPEDGVVKPELGIIRRLDLPRVLVRLLRHNAQADQSLGVEPTSLADYGLLAADNALFSGEYSITLSQHSAGLAALEEGARLVPLGGALTTFWTPDPNGWSTTASNAELVIEWFESATINRSLARFQVQSPAGRTLTLAVSVRNPTSAVYTPVGSAVHVGTAASVLVSVPFTSTNGPVKYRLSAITGVIAGGRHYLTDMQLLV